MEYKNNLALVAIVKDESPYIIEWIEFHRLVGVDKFYIYDNGSIDNLKEILMPYIEKGIVEYQYFPGDFLQTKSYTDAINKYKYDNKYMGFIDIDEFIVPTETQKISDIIDSILNMDQNSAGVAINWRMYGSSGYEKKPKGLVTEIYKQRAVDNFDANKHIKTICNPRKVEGFKNPHFPIYMKGYYSIDEDKNIINGPFNINGKCRTIRINHYFTKSKIEYAIKALRGKADNKTKRNMDDFNKHNHNEIYDNIMDKYINILKSLPQVLKSLEIDDIYTDKLNSQDIQSLINNIERAYKKDIYLVMKSELAKIYDSIRYKTNRNKH